MILTVAHTKGGVGKTTLSIQIAAYLRAVKKIEKLSLIDGDPQKSTLEAITERNSMDGVPPITCTPLTTGKEILGQFKSQHSVWDQIIIDIGARESNALKAALVCSDVVLIPVQPRGFDLQALRDFHNILEDARDYNDHIKACAVLSLADPQGSSNSEAEEYLANYKDIQVISNPIIRRKVYATSSMRGLSVFEESPRDQKACREIESLVSSLYGF